MTTFGESALVRYSALHSALRTTRRPVAAVPVPKSKGNNPLPPHQNWLRRGAFDLPPGQLSPSSGAAGPNLINIIENAATRLAVDDVVTIRPIGSLAYAQCRSRLNWDVVRDLDVWVYVSADTIASGDWIELHEDLQRFVYEALIDTGVPTFLDDRTGYVFVGKQEGSRRLVELKLAQLDWLERGIQLAHLRRAHLLHLPRPAHMESPRLEWAAHTPHENYYCSRMAHEPFRSVLGKITMEQAHHAQAHTYTENLAEAFRALTPFGIARGIASRSAFSSVETRVLKKQLMLAVMLGNETRRESLVEELEAVRVRSHPQQGPHTAGRSWIA